MWYFRPLDWLNFFLADVRGGLGPYVGVFLLTQADWNQATIGAVLTVSGLIGIILHAPIGALIDATRFKRGLIIGGTCALAISAVAIAWAPTMPIVLTADILMAVARNSVAASAALKMVLHTLYDGVEEFTPSFRIGYRQDIHNASTTREYDFLVVDLIAAVAAYDEP